MTQQTGTGAYAPNDALDNPVVPGEAAYLLVYDESQGKWVRARGTTSGITVATGGLPAGAATEAKQDTQITDLGSVTETAPATDTASSGLNGRLQRIAQRLTSLIALLPGSLGQKTKANSLAVTLASDQDALPVTDNGGSLTVDGTVGATQSGTWTVQPGNTANTTAWKVDGSAVTQPVSGTVTATPSGTQDENLKQVNGSTTNTGTGAAGAGTQRVAVASDSSLSVTGTVAVTESGTWTVQPGNTANTTAWKVDGSAVTQPVSAVSLPLPSGASTAGNQTTEIGHLARLAGSLVPVSFDYVSLTPPDQPTSVVFKTGGSGGSTVRTLTIAYTGTDISSVTAT